MAEQTSKPPRSIPHIIFATIAIVMGTYAFLQAGLRGHSAGWEEMIIYTAPAVIGALIAIAMRRQALSYVALFFGLVLGLAGFFLGA
jgi:hypothetical protein